MEHHVSVSNSSLSPDFKWVKLATDSASSLVVPRSVSAPQQVEAPANPAQSTTGRWRIITLVAMAAKRFQSAMNPTYSYGKRAVDTRDSAQPAALLAARSSRGATVSGRSLSTRQQSGRTASGRPLVPGVQHGFKGHILFRSLPEVKA